MSTHTPLASFRGLFVAAALSLGAGFLGTGCGPKYPNCEEDADCKAGEFCVNQLCQKCRSNEDCGVGQQCNAGACEDIAGYCDDSHPCGTGQNCVANRCESAPVETPDQPVQSTNTGCELQPVYFSFDSSSLEPSARDAVAKNADCARQKGIGGLKITGYTDPRGTEEYNLALGDRRARTVADYTKSLGLDPKNITSASMGEEMARGEDESGWAQDRRAEFAPK